MTDEEKERRVRELIKQLNSEFLPRDDEGFLRIFEALSQANRLYAHPRTAANFMGEKAVKNAEIATAKSLI